MGELGSMKSTHDDETNGQRNSGNMQIVINVNARLMARAGFVLVAGAAAFALIPHAVQAGALPVPTSFTGGTTISAAAVNANFTAIDTAVDDNDARITALEAILAGVTRSTTELTMTGLNLNIVSGSGTTEGTANGTGNLVIGYNENTGAKARTGSHTLVMGPENGYTGYWGVNIGVDNLTANEAIALGGDANVVSDITVIVGGHDNTTQDAPANTSPDTEPSSFGSVIIGGGNHVLRGENSVIVGGESVTLIGDEASGGAAGNGSDGVGLTLVGCRTYESDFNTFASFGSGTGVTLTDVGEEAGSVNLGRQGNSVNVGESSSETVVGATAANVRVGQNATANVLVGDGAASVELGSTAVNVTVGQNATGIVNVGVNSGGNVTITAGATADINVGFGANNANFAP
jgi:hypothetical protein